MDGMNISVEKLYSRSRIIQNDRSAINVYVVVLADASSFSSLTGARFGRDAFNCLVFILELCKENVQIKLHNNNKLFFHQLHFQNSFENESNVFIQHTTNKAFVYTYKSFLIGNIWLVFSSKFSFHLNGLYGMCTVRETLCQKT